MSESIADVRFRELRAAGYTGTIADMERQRLCAKTGQPIGVNLSLDDLYRLAGENQWPYAGFTPVTPPFNPLTAPGVLGVYFGNLGANGADVATWTDRSANGNTLSSGSLTAPKVVTAALPNGGSAARFVLDSVNSRAVYLTMANILAGKTAAEAWVVAKNTAAGVNNGFWRMAATAVTNTHHVFSGTMYEGFCASARYSQALSAPQLTSLISWHVYRAVATAAGVELYLNDVLIYSSAVQTFLAPDVPIDIGSSDRGVNPDTQYDGQMGFLYLRDRKSPADEATAIRTYITTNTGV